MNPGFLIFVGVVAFWLLALCAMEIHVMAADIREIRWRVRHIDETLHADKKVKDSE